MALAGQRIVIIGAGIAGLAAAMALAQRGARVRVLEQAPALGEVGAGLQLGPNSVAVLESLGLRDACEAVVSAPETVELRDYRAGARVARLPMGAAAVARYGRPYWQAHRADLIALLAAGATEAGAEIVTGVRVAQVETGADECRIETEAGGSERAGVVIAADGIRSTIRDRLFAESADAGQGARFTGHVAWRGLIEASRLPAGLVPSVTSVTMGPGRHLVSYPLRGGRLINFVAVEERADWVAEGWSMPDDPARLRAAFAGWNAQTEALLAAVDQTFLWGLFDHAPVADWVRGRVALIGDACHPMLPFLAQGAAMGLEDAWVLAAELDTAASLPEGLGAYAARRAPRTTRVQRAAALNGRLYHLRNPVARRLAHLGLGALGAAAPGLLMRKFDWIYGADVVSAMATQ